MLSGLKKWKPLVVKLSMGLHGSVHEFSEVCLPGSTFYSTLKVVGLEDIVDNTSICANFRNPAPPSSDFIYPSKMLSGAVPPPRLLSNEDYMHVMKGGDRDRRSSRGRSTQINQVAAR